LNLQVPTDNIATKEPGALKFENCKFESCHFTLTAAKEDKLVHVQFFFCDSLENKIVFLQTSVNYDIILLH
jgi:hypothetical protein